MFSRLRSLMEAMFQRTRFERDMDDELRTHRETYTGDLVARGVSPHEAAQRARREFGAVQNVKDECRDARGLYWPGELQRNFTYAFRLLRKNPGFTLTAILTLALCIGANTAIFSVVDAVLFRPLPYPEPDRLASVATLVSAGHGAFEQTDQDGTTWEAIQQHSKTIAAAVFSGMPGGINLVAQGGAKYVLQQRVSAGYFGVLGVPLLIGREFSGVEDRAGGPAVAVLSNALWRGAFHADPSVAGQKITLRGEPYTVIGVMPPGFQTSVPADVWTPLRPTTTGEGGGTNYTIIARLRRGVTWPQANAEMNGIGHEITSKWRLKAEQSAVFHLLPLQRGLTADLRRPLFLLWAAVGVVLLIGCVNIAGLLLARSGTRTREIATRLALGSGRAAIVRQLLAESLLLAIGGGMAGIALGYCALLGLNAVVHDALGIWQTVSLDARVLAATAFVSLLTSVLFGVYPALAATGVDLRSSLALGGSRGASKSRKGWARGGLVAAEVALGVVLLTSAGLLIRTLAHFTGLQPGYDGRGVITASLSLQDARYRTAKQVNRLFDESLAGIAGTPGVEAAGIALSLPYQRALNEGFTRLDGPRLNGQFETTNLTYVTPDYFKALRIPLLRGRPFAAADRADSRAVAIVNQAFAKRYLRDQDAVGSHVKTEDTAREIVGVIGDVQEQAVWGDVGPIGPVPDMYIPAAQTGDGFYQMVHTWFSPSWVVRTTTAPAGIRTTLQDAVAAIDPQLPFAEFRTLDEIRSKSMAIQRLETALFSGLAALALLLAALGIYGLISHSVVERTREFGIRMALGASVPHAVGALALPGILLTCIGLAAGCVLARAASTMLRSVIWGVEPGDPFTFVAACGVLLLTAALASVLPSLRVAAIDPARTLREE